MIRQWKVIISANSAEHAGQAAANGSRRILSTIEILPPKAVCTETYLVAGAFDTEEEANNFRLYLRCKFTRFLLGIRVLSQHIARDSFAFVPVQDFTCAWTDEALYQKYELSEDEIALIEHTIRPMP